MKENINILYLKHVGNYLDGENLKYLAIEKDEEHFIIRELPHTFNGYISSLYEYLCYDYDELSLRNKNRYKNYYKCIKKADNKNIYSLETKIYNK